MRGRAAIGGLIAASLALALLHPRAALAADKAGAVRVLVSADQESTLSAQMAGRVTGIDAVLGQRVQKGQVILHFDCDEQKARLDMAKAELDGAKSLYENKKQLQAMQSASLLEVSQAAAAVEKAQAQIQLYGVQLRMCTIKAPFSGRVTRLRIKPYESVTVGQPLVDFAGDAKLKIEMNIPSNWAPRIKKDQPFSVHIDETGKDYAAQVWHINGRVDAVSQTIAIEGEFSKHPADLLPGMSGIATFPGIAN